MRKVVRTDVLVVGGGGAGMRAAIAAADCGAEVILASKLRLGTAGATAYPIARWRGTMRRCTHPGRYKKAFS